MSPTYQMKIRVRLGARGAMRVAGVLFLVAAVALYALNLVAAPPLASMARNRGIVGDVTRHIGARSSAPYLTMSIGGLTYVIHSYRRTWFDSLQSALRRGDTATVWGAEVPNGWYQVWQLQKGDSMVMSYGERAAIEGERNERGKVVAEVIGAMALAMLALSAVVPQRA